VTNTDASPAALVAPAPAPAPSRLLEIGAGFWCVQRSHSRSVSLASVYRDTRAEIALACELGFDTAWFGEHHFSYDGYLPSPLAAWSYVAAAVPQARLGVGVIVLPLHGPERVAAGVAAVRDLGGRAPRLGFGLGYRADEVLTIGIDPKERMRTFLRYVDELLSGQYDEELGETEMWMGGGGEKAIGRAARRGLPIVMPPNAGPRAIARAVDTYAASFVPRHDVDGHIGVIKEVWIEDDPRRLAEARERLKSMWRHYATFWVDDDDDRVAKRDEPVEGLARKSIMGSSAQVLDELAALVDAGARSLHCRIRFDGSESSRVREVLERVAAEVMPQLRAMA
jgi:alkanesulfonate monooxygenase SsuD/methylene tetrahydromethanopterin reductase-like flavin-dependent oxidoreductase (luciferase family)